MTELEKKMLLTKDEYEYLMELFTKLQSSRKLSSAKQINYYFDTDKFEMNRQNTTCRIRFKDGKYKGTIKRHFIDTDKSIEDEIEIYDGVNNNAFTDMGMNMYGSIMTERCIVIKNAGLEVVLDKNEYLGIIDYELEIEYDPENELEARIVFHHIRNELMQLRWYKENTKKNMESQATPSKSKRFFERYISERSKTIDSKLCCCKSTEVEYGDPDEYLKNYITN